MRKNDNGDDGRDVWNYLPAKFVLAYTTLVTEGMTQVGSSAGSYGHRRGGDTAGPLKSSVALQQKARIDRILRKLALETTTGQIAERIKCSGCAKYVQAEWNYCAWCGSPPDSVYTDGIKGLPLR